MPAAQPLPPASSNQVPPPPPATIPAAAPPPPQTNNKPAPAPPVAKPAVNIVTSAAARSETPPVRSASASLETVERAINDLRISNASGSNANVGQQGTGGDVPRRVVDHRRRGGRRAHPQNRATGEGGGGQQQPPALPKEDFDFDRSNSKFDKASIYASANTGGSGASPSPSTPVGGAGVAVLEQATSPEPGEIIENAASPTVKEEPRKFYDRTKSFFDDISSDTKAKVDGGPGGARGGPGAGVPGSGSGGGGGGRGGGRGGRGGGRNRRDEERTKNLTTFGEAGTGAGNK